MHRAAQDSLIDTLSNQVHVPVPAPHADTFYGADLNALRGLEDGDTPWATSLERYCRGVSRRRR